MQLRVAAPSYEPQALAQAPCTPHHRQSPEALLPPGLLLGQQNLPDGLPRLVEVFQDALHVFVDFAVFPVHGECAPTVRTGCLTSQSPWLFATEI